MTTLTIEQIVEMAKEAGCGHEALDLHWVCPENLEAFAKLVDAKATAREREACAKVCEPQEAHDDPLTAWKIAQAIRARGTNE
jgi:hypothetical protein